MVACPWKRRLSRGFHDDSAHPISGLDRLEGIAYQKFKAEVDIAAWGQFGSYMVLYPQSGL